MVNKKKIAGNLAKATRVAKKLPPGRLQLVLALGILALGILFMVILVKLKKPPKRTESEILAPLVKLKHLSAEDIQMFVSGFGTVRAKVQVEIAPQVSGKVVSIHPQFKAGGFIKAGEQLLGIDPRDYELAVQQAEAAVAEAQVKIDLEKAEAQVVQSEWEQLYPGTKPDSPLVLRQPQIRQAQARLESARATLLTAKLNLERTELSLPMDVRIVSETVDLGQFITVGKTLAVAYGLDSVEIVVPLEDRELAWFDIPAEPVSLNGNSALSKKTAAQVMANFAGAEHIWTGCVVRTTGTVDTASRLVSVVVEVDKPFDTSDSRVPLLPGMFVEVLIKGKILKNAVAVPRDAIHNRNVVWIINGDRLHIKSLEIVRFDREFAYVISGLDEPATIVISSLDTVVDGMKIRTKAAGSSE